MNRRILYISAAVALVGFTGCNNKLKDFRSDYFIANPNPVETVGQNAQATITGNIPAKFMVKNAKVTATPTFEYGNSQTATGTPVIFQGQDARANGQVVSYANGGSVLIPVSVPYNAEMADADLYLTFDVDQNGKTYTLAPVKVAEGINATSTLASAATVTPAVAPDKFQRVISEKFAADIMFLVNQANIRSNQTSKEDYKDLNRRLQEANAAPDQEIAGVNISSFASPEGSLEFNTQLAEKREQNTTSFMENQLKQGKITNFGEITSQFTPEDWEGFQKLVEQSNIQDKDLILEVLRLYPDPEQREKEIRNLTPVFNELATQILPQLRYSRIQAQINTIGKSDEELINLFNTDPEKLTADEMLYVATLTNDNTRKQAIYNKVIELYPTDYRAFNNLANTQYVAGDYAAASLNYDRAASRNPQAKEVMMNRGLLSMLDGKLSEANEKFGASAGVPELNDAMGVYYLSTGELSKANVAFGDAKTNNAALAQILSKDYSAAQQTLNAIASPDATTAYLKAVLAARTNNEAAALANLREAVKLDRTLLERAKKDVEFAKFNLVNL